MPMNVKKLWGLGAIYWIEFKGNRRLQLGFSAILLMVLFEGSMRWVDRLAVERAELRQVRAELANLRAQSRDQSALRHSLKELERARQKIEEKLWTVHSEAVGQARMKEWLNDLLKRCGVANLALNVSGSRPVVDKATEEKDSVRQTSGNIGLYEFRSVIKFPFSPETLEKVLAEIESGELLSSVESLTVNRREQRVELTVRVLMRVGGRQKLEPLPVTEVIGR